MSYYRTRSTSSSASPSITERLRDPHGLGPLLFPQTRMYSVPMNFIRAHWRTGLAFLIGVIVGPGALWRYRETDSLQRSTGAQVTRLNQDTRDKLEDKLIELVKETNLFYALESCDSSTAAYSVGTKIAETNDQISLVADDIFSIENQLAKVEARPVRDIVMNYLRPGPPGSITVEQVLPSGKSVVVARSPLNRPPCPKL